VALSQEFVDSRDVPPRSVELTVLAKDPAVRGRGHLLRAKVRVPAGSLEAGPRGSRFFVLDYDAGTRRLAPSTILAPDGVDAFQDAGDDALLSDPAFAAQNVYAIAARTLETFEFALGRRLPWAFNGHQLYLVPHAFSEANAYYAGEDRAIYFGHLERPGDRPIQTSLSHDIIAHETTHAVLDGLRRRFQEPGLPDQAAFHEAFADVVALLSVISMSEVVADLLGPGRAGRIPTRRTSAAALRRTALFDLARELGQAVVGERGSALRRSVALEPGTSWRSELAFEEPHRRGEVLVAAMMQALAEIWAGRLAPLRSAQGVDRDRAAEEGAKAGDHLLRMAIRAIDYTPPIEFEFEDFLDAMLLADSVVVPDDEHGYRPALERSFATFGIGRPAHLTTDLRWSPLRYAGLNYVSLRSSPDEVFRFIWENADALGISRAYATWVEEVRASVRVGPDGFVVNEVLADYTQVLEARGGELLGLGIDAPRDLPSHTRVQLWGGGTLIFDQFGRARYLQVKYLDDWDRQTRRLGYLVRNGLRDSDGGYGFSLGTPRGQRFAEFHAPESHAGESW
jgi:hypothetical protein